MMRFRNVLFISQRWEILLEAGMEVGLNWSKTNVGAIMIDENSSTGSMDGLLGPPHNTTNLFHEAGFSSQTTAGW